MRLTILAALFVGLVYSFYHWAIPNLWQVKDYSPLVLNQNSPSFVVDETFYYGTKVRKILNGSWPAGTETGEAVGAISMAILAKISGGIDKAFMLADFIFPALTFLILAYLLNLWLKNRLLMLTAALLVLTFYHYLTYFPYLPSVVKLMIQYWKEGSYSTLIRSFHPQISLGLFFIFAAFLWEKSSWWLTALLLALLTYTHFYYWTVALIWLLIKLQKKATKILIVFGVLTIPYWFNLIHFLANKNNQDFLNRNYFYLPITLNQGLLLIFGFCLAYLVQVKAWRWFWLSFYGAIITLVVISMLTKFGYDDPIGHWFLRVVNPLTAILMITSLFNKLKLKPALLILICLLVLGFQFRLHWQYFKENAEAFSLEPEKQQVFNWLNQATPRNSTVITANLKDNLYLSVYTHNQVYLPQAQLDLASTEELTTRFLQIYRLAEIPAEKIRLMFADNQELKAIKRFELDDCAGHYLYFRQFNGSDYYGCSIPENKLQQILAQYESMSPQLTYPADYWLWGPYEKQWAQINPETIANWQKLWENSQYKIYKLN
jgi:hypothetical protein